MRGQKRVEDARRRAGVPRIHVFGKKARRGSPGQRRTCPGYPRLYAGTNKDGDGRNEIGHDEAGSPGAAA